MKRLFALLATSLLAVSSLQAKDDQGHTLVKLWSRYYTAADADKPTDALAALEDIISAAGKDRLAWDFWDAARLRSEWTSRRNWKLHRQAEADRSAAVEEFGEPIAVYVERIDRPAAELYAYASEHKERLAQTFNPEFYGESSRISGLEYSTALVPLLQSDFEFVLWDLFLRKQAESEIAEYYSGAYPKAALVEFNRIGSEDYESYRQYALKYNSKAVSLLARERLLEKEFSDLKEERASSRQFLDLSAKCDKFVSDREILCKNADEKPLASCCTRVDRILGQLKDQSIGIGSQEDTVTVIVRNLSKVNLKVLQDKKVFFETSLDNPVRSFYVPDTLGVTLPTLPDGDYTIECSSGKVTAETEMSKYTLSLTSRAISTGTGVYVADYRTGEPLRDYTVTLLGPDGDAVASTAFKGASGFVQLPEEFSAKIKDTRTYSLRAQVVGADGTVRMSRSARRGSFRAVKPAVTGEDDLRVEILTDRSAFNPDETVFFKAVLYTGRYSFKTLPQGEQIEAVLTDPQGNELARKALSTNEFGSVDGSFTLTRTDRGGLYNIGIFHDGERVGSRSVQVDDFVLPTFELTFAEDDRWYLEGDKIAVEGAVQAYSGHSLGSSTVSAAVTSYGDKVLEQELELSQDGKFRLEFNAKDGYRTYFVTLKVTDATGETLEFSTSRTSYDFIRGDLSLANSDPGTCDGSGVSGFSVMSEGVADLDWKLSHFGTKGLSYPGLKVAYKVFDGSGKVICETASDPDLGLVLPMSSFPSGTYKVQADASVVSASGKEYKDTKTLGLLKISDSDTSLDADITCMFRDIVSDPLAVQVGATRGPVWIVAEVYDGDAALLDSKLVKLGGRRGTEGSLYVIRFARKASWRGNLTLKLLTFRDGRIFIHTREVKAAAAGMEFPLEFTRFFDTTDPGTGYAFSIRTAPGAECAVSVFDKSTETVRPSVWTAPVPMAAPAAQVTFSTQCGCFYCWGVDVDYTPYIAYGSPVLMSKSVARVTAANGIVDEAVVVEEEDAVPAESPAVTVRENFANTLCWEPCLLPDSDGNVTFSFNTSDKLSTYYVQIFAHDKTMGAAVSRREFKVTIPVKIAIVQPQYLYEGDRYAVRLTVSNNLDSDVSGRIAVRCYDGTDYNNSQVLGVSQWTVTVSAGGTTSFTGYVMAPSNVSELGILAQFIPDDSSLGGDAVLVSVPVSRPVQRLREAHSALLKSGADAEALADSLRALFVNVPGQDAVQSEISIRRMLGEALPTLVEPESDNCLALSEALYARRLLEGLGIAQEGDAAAILRKLLACRNSDGGFAWFEGMQSSPVLTALLLQRFAAMPDLVEEDVTRAAVLWLDKVYFSQRERPLWCGGMSLQTYVHTRSLWAAVPFDASDIASKTLRQFRKDVKSYLASGKSSDLKGELLAKVRRISVIRTLTSSAEGLALAKAWGLGSNPARKLARTQKADYESLLQYACPHRSGGMYYPNAVMPFRGLLESELYAHSLLCDLLSDIAAADPSQARASEIADGVRLWMMVQKETQQWGDDPAFIEALSSVFHGSQALLDTRVLVLGADYEKPFEDVKAAGNGFTVSRVYTRDGKPLADGDVLHVGDKVTAQYRIWNEENRSFVRLTAPRPACMRPVEQLSGRYGWRFAPLNVYAGYSVTPQGYRSVLSDRTQYWFDSYPEEDTVISEEFFVTQEGSFSSPVVEIESLYAPHYRANDDGRAAINVEP